jgi:hypothetical protein
MDDLVLARTGENKIRSMKHRKIRKTCGTRQFPLAKREHHHSWVIPPENDLLTPRMAIIGRQDLENP